MDKKQPYISVEEGFTGSHAAHAIELMFLFKNPNGNASTFLYMTVLHWNGSAYNLGQTYPYLAGLVEDVTNLDTSISTYELDYTNDIINLGGFTVAGALVGKAIIILPSYITEAVFDTGNTVFPTDLSPGGTYNFVTYDTVALQGTLSGAIQAAFDLTDTSKIGLENNARI